MMITPRQAMDGYLSGRAARPVLAPFVERLAARVTGTSYQAMGADAGNYTAALSKTANLLGLDAVVVGADDTLLAEALGATIVWRDGRPELGAPPLALADEPAMQARLKVAIEAASRLFQVIRGAQGCIAAMTGPATLASQIYGQAGMADGLSALKPALVSVAEAYCKTRPDILLLLETQSHLSAGDSRLRRTLSAIKNVASYYDVRFGIYAASYVPADLAAFNADVIVLGGDESLMPEAVSALGQSSSPLGLALPMGRGACADIIRSIQDTSKSETMFLLTSSGDIAADADIERLRNELSQLRELR
ncbi:MAG: hypothetical protein H3C28_09825 [Sphingomonadales bacterium]|nr:hypothetical protein [Sphingomonadales bacterium]